MLKKLFNKADDQDEIIDEEHIRQRQYMVLGVGVAAMIAIFVFSFYEPQAADYDGEATETETVSRVMGAINERERWREMNEKRIDDLERINKDLQGKLEAMAEKGAAPQQNAFGLPAPPATNPANQQLAAATGLPPNSDAQSLMTASLFGLPGPGGVGAGGALPPPLPGNLPPLPLNNLAMANAPSVVADLPEENIVSIKVLPDDANQPKPAPVAERKQTYKNYLPAGSFIKTLLLAGVDAPTGGAAQQNPLPFLIKLANNGQLPNGFRSRVRDCFMLMAGYGDIASERVYGRAETLSCVMKNGEIVEVPIQGYISGEDGKAGMRGVLVSKQGSLIAKSLLAGLFSGVGKAVADSYTNVSTNPLGSVSSVDPSKQVQYGLAGGVSGAMDRISQWYLDRADETYPILEIAAGRNPEVIITQGVDIGDLATETEKQPRRVLETRPSSWDGPGALEPG